MERVLSIKMEALVQDLSSALEESSRTSSARWRWGLRRRAHSTGNLPAMANHKTQSDDSASSGEPVLSRDRGMSSLHQSDSDDVGPTAGVHRHLAPFSLQARQGNIESDSFNENFSPVHPSTRRFGSLICGKRKRSVRERSVDCTGEQRPQGSGAGDATRQRQLLRPPQPLGRGRVAGAMLAPPQPAMEVDGGGASEVANCDMMSSSSLSSSESDTGIYTNDEGREGDDEQSDWFGGEGGHGWWEEDEEGPPGGADGTTDGDDDAAFGAILSGSFEHLSEEAKESYRAHVRYMRRGISGREIRGGRRRVRDERPGFSVFTSANEKLSRFLQDPTQVELKLHPMKEQERDQLCQLAALYSLKMSTDPTLTCPVLTKTRNTMQLVRVEQGALNRLHSSSRHHHHHLSDFKRRRKMTQPMEVVAAGVSPIPDSNVGSAMLRNMGWEPGKGLGAHGTGITEPVVATVRPRYQGLGHSHTSS